MMNKNKAEPENQAAAPEQRSAAQNMPVTIHAQYIKDMSFESPMPPTVAARTGPDKRPVMDIGFSMDARKLEDTEFANAYEVTLGVRATAKAGDQTVFICEIAYGTMVTLEGVPEDDVHPLLLIEMPRHAFPFVRQIVASVTQQAGYMPLMLAPVDFRALYMQRFANAGAQK